VRPAVRKDGNGEVAAGRQGFPFLRSNLHFPRVGDLLLESDPIAICFCVDPLGPLRNHSYGVTGRLLNEPRLPDVFGHNLHDCVWKCEHDPQRKEEAFNFHRVRTAAG
jgi:hypothetical protein